MNVAVVGSRSFTDYELVKKTLDSIHGISLIVSGGAVGADSLGERYARENNIPTKIFLPDWKRFGRSAGFKRNHLIIQNADIVIAFWDGVSKGTAHSIQLARSLRKDVQIVRF